jgi:hypothetical protein
MSGKPRKRDNFTNATIRKLKGMAGDVCSMPECRVITGGAKSLRDNTYSIGVAAHICAASPGGPRYDPLMTKEQRRSYENGVWLCEIHARLIDEDPNRFPVSKLKAWKDEAELWSMSSVGQQLMTKLEHEQNTRYAVGRTVLEIMGGGDPLKAPIQNIVTSYEENLSNIDPRFSVKLIKGPTGNFEHHIFAKKEDANFNINFKNVRKGSAIESSLKRLIDYGEAAEFGPGDFEFSGSKLFESLSTGTQGKITIENTGKPIELSISLIADNNQEIELATFNCKLISGAKYGTIKGKAYAGLLEILFVFSMHGEPPKVTLTFNPNFWINQEISRLGYFSKIQKISKALTNRTNIKFSIELIREHQSYPIGVGDANDTKGFIANLAWHIEILQAARKISQKISDPIFARAFDISKEDEDSIMQYSELAEGDIIENVKAGHEFCKGEFSSEGLANFESLQDEQSESTIRFVENESTFFNLLGNKIKAPPINIAISQCIVNRFTYIDEKTKGRNGFVVSSSDTTKYVMSIDKDRQWILESAD